MQNRIERTVYLEWLKNWKEKQIIKVVSGATPYMYDGETEMSNTMKTHFVTITGLKVDEISGVTTATISTWSEKAYIDFAGFMEAPGLAGGVAIAS